MNKDNLKNLRTNMAEFERKLWHQFKVLRFWNNELNDSFNEVMDVIYKAVN